MIYIYLFTSEYTHKYRHGESISSPIKIIQPLFLSLVLVLAVACGGGGGGGDTSGGGSSVPGPIATSLTAAASSVTSGTSTTLTPIFSNGTGVITPGNISATSGTMITVTPTTTTTYSLTVTNSVGITATTTATITVAPAPTITSLVFPTRVLTPGEVVSTTAVFGGGTGILNPGNITLTSGVAQSVTVTGGIAYTLAVTNTLGASVSQSTFVSTTADPAAPTITSFTASATTVSLGQSVSLTGVFANGSGVITPGNLNAQSGTAVVVTPTANTVYTLTVTNSAGVSVTSTVSINVGSSSTVADPTITSFTTTATAAYLTQGASTTLTAVFSNGTALLTPGNITLTSGTAVSVSPNIPSTYTVKVTNSIGVSISKILGIQVLSPPRIQTLQASSTLIPIGSSTSITATFSDGNAVLTPGNIQMFSGVGVSVKPTTNTAYTVTVTNAAGTSVSQILTIQLVSEAYIVSFTSASSTVTLGQSTTLSAVFWNGTGVITPGNLAITSGGGNVTVTPVSTTTYTLTVTKSDGTSASKTLTVTVMPKQFVLISNMPSKLASHSSTLLDDGRVLIAGGNQTDNLVTGVPGIGAVDKASIFDPSTNTFTNLPNMATKRQGHLATLLKNGLVLISSGYGNGSGVIKTTLLFNPYTNTFSDGPLLPNDFTVATWTRLSSGFLMEDGRAIYFASSENFRNRILIYDPISNSFIWGPSLSIPTVPESSRYGNWRTEYVVTLLANKTILVTGGLPDSWIERDTPETTYCEIYDPVSNTVIKKGNLLATRRRHTATLLPSGKVLIYGGFVEGVRGGIRAIEIFDPNTGTSRLIGQLSSGRYDHEAFLLPNHKVLIFGGTIDASTPIQGVPHVYTTKAEYFDPVTETFSLISPMNQSRLWGGFSQLNNGKLLLTGGIISFNSPADQSSDTAEIFDPQDNIIPSITSFVSNIQTVTSGSSVTLTPTFTNGTGVINNGVGLVNSGMTYTVVPAVESTYALTVTGPTGIKVSQKIKIFISP